MILEYDDERRELSDYVDSMLGEIATTVDKPKLDIILEYDRLAADLYSTVFANNHYKPLSIKDELKIYEAAVEPIFNKYIK